MVTVLFVREDSEYKYNMSIDSYDCIRDARNYNGNGPVIAHPPCRAWGLLSHMASPAPGEKELSFFAIDIVRRCGGVLEHPSGSRLFGPHLPDVDDKKDMYGGYTILIDQFDFGHVAPKPTKLYICGVNIDELPQRPQKRNEIPKRSICGNIKGTKRCTQKQREHTPELLMEWLILVASLCSKV